MSHRPAARRAWGSAGRLRRLQAQERQPTGKNTPPRSRWVQPGSCSPTSALRRDVSQGLPLAATVVPRKGGGAGDSPLQGHCSSAGVLRCGAVGSLDPCWLPSESPRCRAGGSVASVQPPGQQAGQVVGDWMGRWHGHRPGSEESASRLGKQGCTRISQPSPGVWMLRGSGQVGTVTGRCHGEEEVAAPPTTCGGSRSP